MIRLAAESNDQPLAIKLAAEKVATEMGLSEEDRSELLSSGRQSRFTNRITWAASHLSVPPERLPRREVRCLGAHSPHQTGSFRPLRTSCCLRKL
jgi:hypothetical protein